MEHPRSIVILDFGSQYTHLIARRIREFNVFAEVLPCDTPAARIAQMQPWGLVFSGSPHSVYDEDAPLPDLELLQLDLPLLGICYGMQLLALLENGSVAQAERHEYGSARLDCTSPSPLLRDFPDSSIVWMSHGDQLTRLPTGYQILAISENSPIALIADEKRRRYGVQFHPEVAHTNHGGQLLRNFVLDICQATPDWTPEAFIENQVKEIKQRCSEGNVILGLSGGVDSSVAALLLHRALGKRLHCIFVDNGLLRLNEAEQVERVFRDTFRLPLQVAQAGDRFLQALAGVAEPESKRVIIGHKFVEIFEEEARRIPDVRWLAQGTLYPDVIESVAQKGPSHTIKTHHNVGGLPAELGLQLLEPLRDLFKDEVRAVGRELGLPPEVINRHPFPGPGLGVRIPGPITPERVKTLQLADDIYISELQAQGWYDRIWQALTVLLPVKTVGVMGDRRTYEEVVAIRAVHSEDAMTASITQLPWELLEKVSSRIINEVPGVNRVVYDISSKPPATIEWE
ncbi:MAG: glutamine-hydrolyzing GMP synthase [Candidatus Delongbacteria bacterium]|nr:glutamine-hydrolyzing GMP synthase [Candidatus Delongbacteria bacterium]